MKKMSKEEAKRFKTKPRGRSSKLRSMLLTMELDEVVLLERQEWTWKRLKPSSYCRRLEKKSPKRWVCRELVDEQGWLIERVK